MLSFSEYYQFIATQAISLFYYLNKTLTPLGCILIVDALLLTLVILKIIARRKSKLDSIDLTTSQSSLNEIAGDDVITTQLDLARAYIEMDKHELAKPILAQVIKTGSPQQKKQANELIKEL